MSHLSIFVQEQEGIPGYVPEGMRAVHVRVHDERADDDGHLGLYLPQGLLDPRTQEEQLALCGLIAAEARSVDEACDPDEAYQAQTLLADLGTSQDGGQVRVRKLGLPKDNARFDWPRNMSLEALADIGRTYLRAQALGEVAQSSDVARRASRPSRL